MCHQDNPDLQLWLREAKVLQRAAQSASLTQSLPVFRRLLKANVLTNISLTELRNKQVMIQRKHLLHMLAVENGASCWAEFRQQVAVAPQGSMLPYSIELRHAGYPVLWFSTAMDAQTYAARHGGKVVKVGCQAVVVPEKQ